MKLQFVGVGSAFTTSAYYQSNAIVHADNGKKLLIDCGGDIRFGMSELGLSHKDVDSVYISHLHADHIGGMEWLAFTRFFDKSAGGRPRLFCETTLMKELWETSLKGGCESIEGKVMNLTDYFECVPFAINSTFMWEGIKFTPVQTVHVMSGYKIVNSYGLMIEQEGHKKVFFSTDTQFCPSQLTRFYDMSDIIFHDCETAAFKSGVHANYADLKTLPEKTKKKMWLYHYQPNPKQDAVADGFQGFANKGQSFELAV